MFLAMTMPQIYAVGGALFLLGIAGIWLIEKLVK